MKFNTKKYSLFIIHLSLIFVVFFDSSLYAKKIQLTVVTEDFPPYNYRNKLGEIDGLSTNIVKTILDRAGIDYKIVLLPWQRAYKMAREKKNILIYSVHRTQEREKHFNTWIGPISKPRSWYFYKLASRQDLVLNSMEDAKNLSVGVPRGYSIYTFLMKNGFTKLETTTNYTQNVKKFFVGRFDLLVSSDIQLLFTLKKLNFNFDSVTKLFLYPAGQNGEGYAAFSTGTNQDIIDKVIKTNNEIQEEKFVENLYKRFLSNEKILSK